MTVYRLINEKYKGNLTGMGAYINGGRWNYLEQYMLYAAQHISLALLEVLVHQNNATTNYFLQTLQLPTNKQSFQIIENNSLSNNWHNNINETQEIGATFLKNNNLLYSVVPSIIVKQENNILINPTSTLINQLHIVNEEYFEVDKRFFK